MTNYQERFYELYQFLAGYFHQDWTEVFDWQSKEMSYEPVVHYFKDTNSPELVKKTADELNEFLKIPMPDKELEEVVAYDLGCAYYPPGSGQTYREWLEAVLAVLHEPTVPSDLKPKDQTDSGGWKEYVDEETKRLLNIK